MNDLVNKESGESHSPFTDKELKIIKRLEGEVKTKGDSVALLFSDDEWDLLEPKPQTLTAEQLWGFFFGLDIMD